MSVLDRICGFIVPHLCVGCSYEGTLLCSACRLKLLSVDSGCFSCQKSTKNQLSCSDCIIKTGLLAVHTATTYDDIAKELVWRLKFTGARQAATVMVKVMAQCYAPPRNTYVVPIPTATGRARQRGYDQAVLLAMNYAQQTGASYLHCLRRLGQKQQRGAGRNERKQQLEGVYRLVKAKQLVGSKVLLIDDVTTTGATLEAAAKILLTAGAKNVQAVVFAKA